MRMDGVGGARMARRWINLPPTLIQSVELGFLLPGAEIARSWQEVAALPRFEIGVSPREGFLLSASAVQEKAAL